MSSGTWSRGRLKAKEEKLAFDGRRSHLDARKPAPGQALREASEDYDRAAFASENNGAALIGLLASTGQKDAPLEEAVDDIVRTDRRAKLPFRGLSLRGGRVTAAPAADGDALAGPGR